MRGKPEGAGDEAGARACGGQRGETRRPILSGTVSEPHVDACGSSSALYPPQAARSGRPPGGTSAQARLCPPMSDQPPDGASARPALQKQLTEVRVARGTGATTSEEHAGTTRGPARNSGARVGPGSACVPLARGLSLRRSVRVHPAAPEPGLRRSICVCRAAPETPPNQERDPTRPKPWSWAGSWPKGSLPSDGPQTAPSQNDDPTWEFEGESAELASSWSSAS